jgi:hypothetical protein
MAKEACSYGKKDLGPTRPSRQAHMHGCVHVAWRRRAGPRPHHDEFAPLHACGSALLRAAGQQFEHGVSSAEVTFETHENQR